MVRFGKRAGCRMCQTVVKFEPLQCEDNRNIRSFRPGGRLCLSPAKIQPRLRIQQAAPMPRKPTEVGQKPARIGRTASSGILEPAILAGTPEFRWLGAVVIRFWAVFSLGQERGCVLLPFRCRMPWHASQPFDGAGDLVKLLGTLVRQGRLPEAPHPICGIGAARNPVRQFKNPVEFR